MTHFCKAMTHFSMFLNTPMTISSFEVIVPSQIICIWNISYHTHTLRTTYVDSRILEILAHKNWLRMFCDTSLVIDVTV